MQHPAHPTDSVPPTGGGRTARGTDDTNDLDDPHKAENAQAADAARAPGSTCPLCQPPAQNLLYEAPHLWVIDAGDPLLPGYVRVIWRRHTAEMTDLGATERAELMDAVFRIEMLQRQSLAPDKINIASLGNQVPHLHWHLIPRWRDDPYFPGAIWSTVRESPQQAAHWADRCAGMAPAIARFQRDLPGHLSKR